MQMRPSEVKSCYLIGHIITMGVVSLYISLSNGGHPGVIQEYLIPIYQVGNHWIKLMCGLLKNKYKTSDALQPQFFIDV